MPLKGGISVAGKRASLRVPRLLYPLLGVVLKLAWVGLSSPGHFQGGPGKQLPQEGQLG